MVSTKKKEEEKTRWLWDNYNFIWWWIVGGIILYFFINNPFSYEFSGERYLQEKGYEVSFFNCQDEDYLVEIMREIIPSVKMDFKGSDEFDLWNQVDDGLWTLWRECPHGDNFFVNIEDYKGRECGYIINASFYEKHIVGWENYIINKSREDEEQKIFDSSEFIKWRYYILAQIELERIRSDLTLEYYPPYRIAEVEYYMNLKEYGVTAPLIIYLMNHEIEYYDECVEDELKDAIEGLDVETQNRIRDKNVYWRENKNISWRDRTL